VKILKLVKNNVTFCIKLHIKMSTQGWDALQPYLKVGEVKRDRFERMDVGVKWMPEY